MDILGLPGWFVGVVMIVLSICAHKYILYKQWYFTRNDFVQRSMVFIFGGKSELSKKKKDEVIRLECFFLVKGIHQNTIKEHLVNFIEAKLIGGDVDVFVVLDKVILDSTNSQALIVFSQKPDMEKLHRNLAQRPFEGGHLIGEEVNPPTCIAVSCEGTLKEPKFLELYFESVRIGGSKVEHPIVESEDGSCFILGFEDSTVVERLCSRQDKHTFENQGLRVSPCYKFEGGAIFDQEIHTFPKAVPIEMSPPPEILRFMKRCCFKDLKSQVEANYGTVEFRTSSLNVTCTLTPKVLNFKTLINAWSRDMTDTIHTFISEKVTEKSMWLAEEPEVWRKLMNTLSLKDEDNLNIWQDDAGKLIKLTGSSNKVQSKYKQVLQRIEVIRRELRRTTRVTYYNESKISTLEAMGVMNEVRSRFDDTKMTLDRGTLTVEGQLEDITAVFLEIFESISNVNEHYEPHGYSKDCVRFVRNHEGIMSKLKEAVTSKDLKAELDLREGELMVCIPSEVKLSDVTKIIFNKIGEKRSFKIDREMGKVLDTDEWTKFSEETSEKYDDVCYDCAGGILEVYGYAENVTIVEILVKEFLDENTVRKEVIKMDKLIVQFIAKHRKAAVNEVGQSNDVGVYFQEGDAEIHISGKKAGLNVVNKSLNKMRGAVITDKYEFKRAGCQPVYVSKIERGIINTIERETFCLIKSLPDDAIEISISSDQYTDNEDNNPISSALNSAKGLFTSSKSKDEPKNENKSSSLVLTIYSDSKDNIDKCKAALEEKLDGIYIQKTIESYKETVKNLTKEELDNVEKTTSLVNIKTDQASGIITVYGPQRNVTTADSEIQNKLRANERKKNLAMEAKMLYTIVKWHYEDKTPTQVNLEAYDETSNQIIETAYKDNKPQVKLHDTGGEIYVINFKDMIEYPESDNNDTVRVIRKDIIKAGDINLPKTWDVMGDQENMKMVNLSPTDAEYKQVESKFVTGAKTGAFQNRIPNVQNIAVTKIERIQNRVLYQEYMAKKTQIEGAKPTLPPNMPLERILWHGTAQAAVTSIQQHGFNRSYCGKNGTWFGYGVYFAEDASYSARPWLAVGVHTPPNPPGQNKGYIFMCKVLTGQYTQGNPNMRYLPAVDAAKDPTLMYDSVVDKLANPVEFVINHDTQAYPEYIITFNL